MRDGNHGSDLIRKRYSKRAGGKPADYTDGDTRELIGHIESITSCGGAIRFGKSRDGGVLALGIYSDTDDPYTVYLRSSEDVMGFLAEVADEFTSRRLRREKAARILTATPTQGQKD
jgi:hypothetical protein